jgi:hypothetical protein
MVSKRDNKESSEIPSTWAAEYAAFATLWNDGRRTTKSAVSSGFAGMSYRMIAKQAERFRCEAERFSKLSQSGIRRLIHRDSRTGKIIHLSDEAEMELRHFAIDREQLCQSAGCIVTSAQFDGELMLPVWKSLERYSEWTGYPIVVMPIKYGPVQIDSNGIPIGKFDPRLKGHILYESLRLAPDLNLNMFRMRPTLARYLTSQVCRIGGDISQVFAAPRFELEHLPRIGGNAGSRQAKAVMTCGAVTVPDYRRDSLGQQDRTGEIAAAMHTYGAVVVEFSDNRKVFHFRQLVMGKSGIFYDIDPYGETGVVRCSPQGVVPVSGAVEAMVLGDWHTGLTAAEVRRATVSSKQSILNTLRPSHVCLHDFVDGMSVNPYDHPMGKDPNIPFRAFKQEHGLSSLKHEMKQACGELRWFMKHAPSTIFHLIPSNHPEFVSRYVKGGKWSQDDVNAPMAAKMYGHWVEALQSTRDVRKMKQYDPVNAEIARMLSRKELGRVRFYTRQDAIVFPQKKTAYRKRILMMHGDVGMRGQPTRGMMEFLGFNARIVLGHNHSASIYGPIWRVGVSTLLQQHYVTTPSTAWTNSHCVIFENGQRMIINIIHGSWHA